ncbi:FKBP-type peptidyl-prolyl cis-trans isomerase [Teredinibacter haidensis]|uniref:FKBP-type peptidyl-prolyl cis-trans isomerase n=1 Tax=Teredinibacter haidensis TaxID=2731755 RepID=UPI00094913E3|nr:FKBP-type peptidyl-prolyl cis-trans isomerase [Teredinibacter haidensis]
MNTFVIVIFIALVAYFTWQGSVSKKKAKENNTQGNIFLEKNKQIEGVLVTASGLQVLQLQPGTGAVHAKPLDKVKVHYHGTLIDGTVFDSSVDRGEPIEFSLNQVIPGWTEGLQLMVEGEKSRLFIPSNLGYGNRNSGQIPAGSTLIFDVELIKITTDS